jgi:hypothetical protein
MGFQEGRINLNWNYMLTIHQKIYECKQVVLPLMLAVVANPPDAGYCLQTGSARAGGDLLTATFGTHFGFF